MSEEYTEVKTFRVTMRCDFCDEGYMKATGTYYPTSPPKVLHRCDSCGEEETYRGVSYPYNTYKEN